MMSDDNGFVERPARIRGGPDSLIARLEATAENGKAIVCSYYPSTHLNMLHKRGYKMRSSKIGAPPGKILVWAEKITVPTP